MIRDEYSLREINAALRKWLQRNHGGRWGSRRNVAMFPRLPRLSDKVIYAKTRP